MRGRLKAKEFWRDRVYHEHDLEIVMKDLLKDAVDAGYCEGYNTVLEAAEEVLSKEDYWKIVNRLQKLDEDEEKQN